MSPIPPKIRAQLEQDPKMRVCIWNNPDCHSELFEFPGRAEWEHAFTYAGKQIQEVWAIVGVCWYHHRGPGLKKDFNQYCALRKMDTILKMADAYEKYPKVNWLDLKTRLTKKYGSY